MVLLVMTRSTSVSCVVVKILPLPLCKVTFDIKAEIQKAFAYFTTKLFLDVHGHMQISPFDCKAQAVGQESKEDEYTGIIGQCLCVFGKGAVVKYKLHLLIISSFIRSLILSHLHFVLPIILFLFYYLRALVKEAAKRPRAMLNMALLPPCYTVGLVLSTWWAM